MDLHNFNNNIHSNMTLPSATTTPATSTYFTYSIPGMDITPGPVAFTYVSEFLSLITPAELPLDLVRQFLHSNLTLIDFTKDAIKIESGFIALMSIFAILALVPLISTCAWCCGRRSDQDEADFIRNAPINIHDDSLQQSLNCRKSASVVTLWITFLLLALCDFCLFYANSRLAANVEMTPEMVKSTVHDMEVFLKDTHLQIKHKLDNGFHVAVEKVVKDLEDVDVLLGEPIQAEISAHTGIELAYDSLATISLANAELIYRVLMLQETVGRALKISQEAAARMEELQIQLSVLQRQCTYRDRPLCDTLRIRSFEENGIIDALKTLQEDQTIFRMRYLGEIEFGATVKNLTSEVGVSRSIFSNFPQQVKHDTAYERNYTLEQLESIRHRTKANAQMLTSTINALLERLQGVWPTLEPSYEELQSWSNSYWTAGWVAALVIGWVLLFGLMSYCCFLCESNVKAGVVLLMSVLIICLGSICITFYGVLTLAIGGNTEVFLCRSMYDATTMATANAGTTGTAGNWGNNQLPDVSDVSSYHLLGKLFDKPGYVYAHEPQTGIIGELLRPEGVNRSIVNVSLATALRGCERNQASCSVFQLDAFVNTTQIADLKQFPKVTTAIDAITVSERTMLSLAQTIQNILENMLHTSSFNLATYRVSIGAPTPERDLAAFIDQMQRVALQIQDVATSSRMTTLGSRSKRLQASILQPLEQLQNEILYHLTALELQRDPWAKQVNQTLNHLRNVQGYLEKTAGEICSNQTRVYTERLKAYLTNSKATMSSQLGDTTAKCRPFFDIFDANRIFLCRNIVDYINALWFCIFITLLLWSVGTPVGLNLITIERRINRLRRAQARSAERSDSRSRRRERTTSSAAREPRSASSASRPPLRRTATEETLDIATEESPPPRREQRDVRSRDREMSRARESVVASTPARSRTQQRRTGTDAEDNWGSSSASRATSMEREPSQPRMYTSSSSVQQQRGTQARPQLRKQGTEEFDLEAEDNWQPAPTASSSVATRSESRAGVRRELREQPAYSHSNGRNKPKLQRSGTEDFEIDESETYGAPAQDSAAVAAARRTPPRTAPPPPPPPVMMNRFRPRY